MRSDPVPRTSLSSNNKNKIKQIKPFERKKAQVERSKIFEITYKEKNAKKMFVIK